MNRPALILASTVATGAVASLFLKGMDVAARAFSAQPLLLSLLPIGAILSDRLYLRFAPSTEIGTNTAIDAAQENRPPTPPAMAPLIFVSTLLTHLGGGSAGREGTALQLGAGITSLIARITRCEAIAGGLATRCGLAAGFAAVFGTPAAAAVFALEMGAGNLVIQESLWVAAASWVANVVANSCGATHSVFALPVLDAVSIKDLGALTILAIACGVLTGLFHRGLSVLRSSRMRIGSTGASAFIATALIAVLAMALPNGWEYCGLGAVSLPPGSLSIESMLSEGTTHPFAWLWKALFTLITLGAGMRGGEVTPLFFIGASLAIHLGDLGSPAFSIAAPTGLCLAFAAGLRAPLAATVLGFELFGWETALSVTLTAHLATSIAQAVRSGRM